MTNKSKTVWEILESNAKFMEVYNKYNQSIGNSLSRLGHQKHDVQGRERELETLTGILERPITPVAVLIGEAGSGKSALVEEFVKQVDEGRLESVKGRRYFVVSLRIGNLKALGTDKLQSAITGMLNNLHKLEKLAQKCTGDPKVRICLFIDEMHMLVTIFGPGTKIGGDLMKDVLARSPISVITATTRREFDATVAVDAPFKERFKEIEIQQLPKPIIMEICKNWWATQAKGYEPLPEIIYDKIIDANAIYRSSSAEPRKTLDILEDLVSLKRRKPGMPITTRSVDKIFKDRFGINLAINFDADEIFEKVRQRVKGQGLALYELQKALKTVAFGLDPDPNKPIMTLLLSGSTGSGKTETTKALEEALYPGQHMLVNINMPDYKNPNLEPEFRKRLGEIVRHQPNSIILLDEFEKASEVLMDSMLAILDEGRVNFEVTNREGQAELHSQSLRNTIIIATTNAGHQVFQNFAQFAQNNDAYAVDSTSKAEYEQLRKSLENFLKADGYRPEMLGRFNRIIPYRSLSENVLVKIAESGVQKMIQKFKDVKGINLHLRVPSGQWPVEDGSFVESSDIAAFVATIRAKSDDSTAGGARAIKRELESSVKDTLIDEVMKYPNTTDFEIYVSHDSRLYDKGASSTEGGIVVNALN